MSVSAATQKAVQTAKAAHQTAYQTWQTAIAAQQAAYQAWLVAEANYRGALETDDGQAA